MSVGIWGTSHLLNSEGSDSLQAASPAGPRPAPSFPGGLGHQPCSCCCSPCFSLVPQTNYPRNILALREGSQVCRAASHATLTVLVKFRSFIQNLN